MLTNQVLHKRFSSHRIALVSFRPATMAGWFIVLALCAVPFLCVFLDPNNPGLLSSGDNALTILGIVSGTTGFVLYAAALVLSTRWRVFEKLFGGLNVVYIVHHVLGGLSFVFLLLHPLLLAMSYALSSVYDAAQLLFPHNLLPLSALVSLADPMHLVVLREWSILSGELALGGLAILLILTFYIKLSYHLWLVTHRLLGPLFILAGLHIMFIDFDYGGTALRAYMVAIFVIGGLAYIYRGLLGNIIIRRYLYIIDDISTPTKDVVELILSPLTREVSFKPGQFVYIRFPSLATEDGREWHPFSISSAPSDRRIRLIVKQLGDFTEHMFKLTTGMTAEIEGAYGGFSFTNFKNPRQIWIAGGIGITPFLGMARSLVGTQDQVDLYYSVRTEAELINLDELRKLLAIEPENLRVFPFIGEKQGFLTAAHIQATSGDLDDREIFICGPPPMLKSIRKQLRALGVSNSHIHTEEFSLN